MASLLSRPTAVATGIPTILFSIVLPKTIYFKKFGKDVPISLKPVIVARWRVFTSLELVTSWGDSAESPHFEAQPALNRKTAQRPINMILNCLCTLLRISTDLYQLLIVSK